MPLSPSSLVGAVATSRPLSTRVFARHGIDFCCGGGRPLAEVCSERGLAVADLLDELERETAAPDAALVRWDREPVRALIAHILKAFHAPHREELARLEAMAHKVERVHGAKDPRLATVRAVLVALRVELEQHMDKEEQILFPMILAGLGSEAEGPMHVMELEHDEAGAALRRLRELTDGYTAPAGACTTWVALWAGLADLERALHEHIHLENNILHPRARRGGAPSDAPRD